MNYDEIFKVFNSFYVGKEIKKEVIQDKVFNSEDKEIVEKYVNSFHIMYSIKADKINKKAEENFEEIQIIEVDINNSRAIYDIYGILLSIIPYPILAIFKYKDRVSYAVSNRILDEYRNNKGKIYTSYLIKEEDISRYLKIDINSCQTLIDIYNIWISNIENVVAYYERLDRVIEIIEIGLHIKSNEVLEKLESYIARDCGTYNMKPKEGWNSKLDKYSDTLPFVKKVETHILWEYLSENTFLKNKLEDFANWNDFKESCSYNNSLNDMYYSQYNSRMSDNDEFEDVYENKRNKRYSNRRANIKVEIIKSESKRTNDINNIINELIEEVKEIGNITYSDLANILSEKFSKADNKTLDKVFEAFEKNNIEILDSEENNEENENYELNEAQKQLLKTIEDEPTALEQVDYELKDNSAFMIQAIKKDSFCIRYASDRLKNDNDFMIKAIKEEGLNIEYASDTLRDNEEFILKAAEVDDIILVYASDRLKDNKEFMLELNEIDGRNLAYASDRLKADKDFIFSAAECSMWALAFATDELKDDKEFVLQIVEKNSWTIKHASDRLKNDKDVVLKAIENDAWFLVYARNELRNNREFLLEAINQNSECLLFADDGLKKGILANLDKNDSFDEEQKDNADYMLKLIKKDYFNIKYASDRLKNDSDFILKAINSSDEGFKCLAFATDELKANKEFILKIYKKIGNYTFALASEKLKCDKDFILKLLKFNYLDFAYVDYELRADREFMQNAISENGETIEFANYELRNNKEFMLQAIEMNHICFVYASDRLKNDKEFMLQAIDKNYMVIEYAKNIFRDDKEVVLACLEQDNYGLSLSHASDRLRNDKEFMLQVVDVNVKALKYLSDRLKNDSDFILNAFDKDNRSIEYASNELKANNQFISKINEKIYESIILEYNYVFKDDFLDRNESYGLVGFLEENGINILEKDEFCMKIINRDTGKIVECNHTPLYLVNEVLNKEDMKDTEWLIVEWKLHLSNTTAENLKDFDSYMRRIKLPYSIYQNSNKEKKVIIEYTNENIELEKENKPLYKYINQYIGKNEEYSIIQVYDMNPIVMKTMADKFSTIINNCNVEYRDFIAILPERNSFGNVWHYCIYSNINYIYMLGINISHISDNIIKQIEDYFIKSNVEYYIEKRIDDIIFTMYPRRIEQVDFIIDILESNDIEYETDQCAACIDTLKKIERAQTSLWIFDASKENKEEINRILCEPDKKRVDRLKEWGAPEILIQNELAPINCNYGMIINSKLKGIFENFLQTLELEYSVSDINDYINDA